MENTEANTSTPLDGNALSRTVNVKFHGKAGEFFSIWIVNLLLTIVTLGIYSAWAKVRTNRYFYSNTEVDGHRFSYLGDPVQILKGRIIGLLLFGAYYLASAFSPVIALVIMLVILAATPLLICLSLRFKMHMTSYRNVRFNFTGTYGDALVYFILLPIASFFTLYLALPWVLKLMDEFIYKNITFGEKEVKTELRTSEYYISALGAVAIAFLVIILAILITAAVTGGSLSEYTGPEALVEQTYFMTTFMLAYVLLLVVASSFYAARIRNHIFNTSRINEVASFHSNLSVGRLVFLRITNFLALVFSLGLALPWVKVRTVAILAQVTDVNVLVGADNVLVDASKSASAVGEEVADVFDLDISLG